MALKNVCADDMCEHESTRTKFSLWAKQRIKMACGFDYFIVAYKPFLKPDITCAFSYDWPTIGIFLTF